MSKKDNMLLITKIEFVEWFQKQPKEMQWKLVTTALESDSQIGKYRRLYLRALNGLHSSSKQS